MAVAALEEKEVTRLGSNPHTLPKRFYKHASLADGRTVLLDSRPAKTGARRELSAGSRALAEAMVSEWSAQNDVIDFTTMPMTRFQMTVLDRSDADADLWRGVILAFDVLARVADTDAARALGLIRILAARTGMPGGICAGQGWESEAQVDLRAYHRAKTGALFVAATQMGAQAAGQDPEPWHELGARIGEAFQVADDLRDALCDAESLGKPAGQDAAHARPSAVATLGVQGAVRHLRDILSGAIASIPSCPGEARLAALVNTYAARMTPVAPHVAPHAAGAARA